MSYCAYYCKRAVIFLVFVALAVGCNSSGGSGGTGETSGLSISLSNPPSVVATGQMVTISADASVVVVGVQFQLGDVDFGAEDTVPPYSISLDTGELGEGTFMVTAVARDPEGNTATATPVTFSVLQAVPPFATGELSS